MDRFDLYGAIWLLCYKYHSGQGSRGYRILSLLHRIGYDPGYGLQHGRWESDEQRELYLKLAWKHRWAL